MCKESRPDSSTEDYLMTLEEVKKQYQQYVEVSELYSLPTQKEEEALLSQPASLDKPLTTNSVHVR